MGVKKVTATAPTTPEVDDACGNAIIPTLLSTVDTPDPLTCEGTRVYTYEYKDCSGLATNWVYTYTLNDTTDPTPPTARVSRQATPFHVQLNPSPR